MTDDHIRDIFVTRGHASEQRKTELWPPERWKPRKLPVAGDVWRICYRNEYWSPSTKDAITALIAEGYLVAAEDMEVNCTYYLMTESGVDFWKLLAL